jgi:predicted acetyltransferase
MGILVEPSPRYKDQFIEAVQEFQREGRHQHYDLQRITRDFEGFIRHLHDQRDRTKIAPHLVPATDFWLIDNEEFIGRLALRHELNEVLLKVGGHIGYEIRPSRRRRGYGKEILRLGLEQARQFGMRHVLVTCDENNLGSKRIIESNGGQFENAVMVEGSPVKKLRYWFDLAE